MIGHLSMGWSDVSGIVKMENAARKLGSKKFNPAAARVLNRAGGSGRTHSGKALIKQTGLKRKTIVAAMKPKRATAANLQFQIRATGGDIALKHFNARETRKGVSATPFGKKRVFAGTFTKGGRFPRRVGIGRGGHVFKRSGAARMPIEKQRSGVIIPREMIKDESARAWTKVVGEVLPRRMAHELTRLTGAVFTFGG